MWEVSRPKLTSPNALLGCEEIGPVSNGAISRRFLQSRRRAVCGICWVQSNGQSACITLIEIKDHFEQVGG